MELDGVRLLRLDDGYAAVRAGGVWRRADSIDALPWVHEQQGYAWFGDAGERLEPVIWDSPDVDRGEMRAMAPHGVLWGRAHWPSGSEGPLPVVIWLAREDAGMDDHPQAVAALVDQGFFVLTYDRRGRGNSRLWEPPEEMGLEQHASDLDDWMPFLAEHPMADASDLALFGHGYGGRVARLRPEPSVTISGPGHDRVADPDLDARGPWRTKDSAHGLTPQSIAGLAELLKSR